MPAETDPQRAAAARSVSDTSALRPRWVCARGDSRTRATRGTLAPDADTRRWHVKTRSSRRGHENRGLPYVVTRTISASTRAGRRKATAARNVFTLTSAPRAARPRGHVPGDE
jgi:hypothetical protein